jgi:glutamyl-tRNA reductase
LVYFEGDDALKHICRVATGLDSLVLGEPQILGQLKDAYHAAKAADTLNKLLEKLFQHAFSTAKKVRTDTQIGSSVVSVAYCAVKLSEKIFADLSQQTVMLIGAGEMIELCAHKGLTFLWQHYAWWQDNHSVFVVHCYYQQYCKSQSDYKWIE